MRYMELEVIKFINQKYNAIKGCLDEKGKRIWAASEALSFGQKGITIVSKAIGMSRSTIYKGIEEIKSPKKRSQNRIRKKGGGRKNIFKKQKNIKKALNKLVEPTAKGDPESHLLWTCKSTRNLADSLIAQGYEISHSTTASLLKKMDYSLQVNKKTLEGSSHKDRDAQFRYINSSISSIQKRGQPTISVDTKKKELIGNYKNNGKEFSQKGKPIEVNGHDFPDKKLGKVVPYGIYDIGKNKGWVSVGISSDTAEFAVNSIRTWWYKMGKIVYPGATDLLITADCGGSNGNKIRLWKYELQKIANELNLKIHVRHFPPGTSKWNKIEHRLFSYISKNWRGRPLLTKEVVVNLIANTKTRKGLIIKAVLDENKYEIGKKISSKEFSTINIQGDEFHPEWNYTISPKIR